MAGSKNWKKAAKDSKYYSAENEFLGIDYFEFLELYYLEIINHRSNSWSGIVTLFRSGISLSRLKVFSRLVSFGLWSLLSATFCGGCLPQIIWLGLKSNHKLLCIYFGDLLTANQCQKFQLHWNHNKEQLVKITRQKIFFYWLGGNNHTSKVRGIDS